MPTIKDIFNAYVPRYLAKFADQIPAEHRKVITAIRSCRTAVCGMTVYQCTDCGKNHHVFRSCGNRHCPSCQQQKARDWKQRQTANRLPGQYFMITFTVPEEIRGFIRSHQRLAYDGLFKASSGAMKTLAADVKYIGGDLPGFFGVLHTWGRQLQYHPHIHYVVPGGAWSTQHNQWRPCRPAFYLPVRALSKIYRARFRDLMVKAGLIHKIPRQVWQKSWNVNCQAAGGARHSIRYLSQYVFKVAISDHRIVSSENGSVTFSYHRPKSRRTRFMKITAEEFIRRFLQHTLPSGFMKVRYYGFMNACCSVAVDTIRRSIEMMNGLETVQQEPGEPKSEKPAPYCPDCGARLTYCYSVLPYQMLPRRDTG